MSARRQFVTVVTGIPRSGTSLVMQMLEAGGIPPLQDAARPADPDNPRGSAIQSRPQAALALTALKLSLASFCASMLKVLLNE